MSTEGRAAELRPGTFNAEPKDEADKNKDKLMALMLAVEKELDLKHIIIGVAFKDGTCVTQGHTSHAFKGAVAKELVGSLPTPLKADVAAHILKSVGFPERGGHG